MTDAEHLEDAEPVEGSADTEAAGPVKHTEASMLAALRERYGTVMPGYPARYILANHVRDDANRAKRTADFIAQDSHAGGWKKRNSGTDFPMHGHEVKVSRADWLTELRDPDKAEAFRPYMNFWWLVVPDKNIVKDGELPEGWGLMVMRKSGLFAVVTAPENLNPLPMPHGMRVALMRSVLRTDQPNEVARIVRPKQPSRRRRPARRRRPTRRLT